MAMRFQKASHEHLKEVDDALEHLKVTFLYKACMHASAPSLSFSLFPLPSLFPPSPLTSPVSYTREENTIIQSDYPQKSDEFRLWLKEENASTSTISGDDPEAASSLFKLKSDRNTVISASPEPEYVCSIHQTPYRPRQTHPKSPSTFKRKCEDNDALRTAYAEAGAAAYDKRPPPLQAPADQTSQATPRAQQYPPPLPNTRPLRRPTRIEEET
ncbi:hypothetical protein NLJ89_g2316 [Agrocybe chaxingu]|uniref:Uncharacterized protein n=1 Tax=Agrocybe chaxingu TaxID=84603 RepID=A0A9W8MYW8_9AGAR|nr:hypothetical protein NLJ89_g2316 [Agrocybe chaxingu]